MSYESEARKHAQLLRESLSNVQNVRTRINSTINGAGSWWTGEGYKAFINEYSSIDSEYSKYQRYIQNAAEKMNHLAQLIRRADDERKAKQNNP